MGTRIGIDCELYYKVGGTAGGGAWTLLSIARDVVLNLPHGEADATSRGGGGFKATEPTLIDASLEFDVIYDPEDTGFQAIRDAKLAREEIGFQAFDENGEGLEANFKIFDFARNEAMEETVTWAVTAKPCYSPDAPPQYVQPA